MPCRKVDLYKCPVCDQAYTSPERAKECVSSHDVVHARYYECLVCGGMNDVPECCTIESITDILERCKIYEREANQAYWSKQIKAYEKLLEKAIYLEANPHPEDAMLIYKKEGKDALSNS